MLIDKIRKLANHLMKTEQTTENDIVSIRNKPGSAPAEIAPETHYYLFELGHSVVKKVGETYYDRDSKNHKWNRDMKWMSRYYDVQYDVVEIDYDEERECIAGVRSVYEYGYPYDWLKEALGDKMYEIFSAEAISSSDIEKKAQQRKDNFSIIKGYRKNEDSYVFYRDKEILCAIDVQPSCALLVMIVGRKRVLVIDKGDIVDSEKIHIRGIDDRKDIFEVVVSDEMVKEVCFANEDGQVLKEKRWGILEQDSLFMVFNKAQGIQERIETLQVALITRNVNKNQGFIETSEGGRSKPYCHVMLYISDASEEELLAVLLLPVLVDLCRKTVLNKGTTQNVQCNLLSNCISAGKWGERFDRSLRDEINRIKIQKDHRYEKLIISYQENWFVSCVDYLDRGAEAGEPAMLYLAAEAISYLDKNKWLISSICLDRKLIYSKKAARELYIQSADKGFPHAILWCAFCFAEGRCGFPVSSEKSAGYLKAFMDSKDKINTILLPDLIFLKEEALEILHMVYEAERDENIIAGACDFNYEACYEQLPDPGEGTLSDRLECLYELMIGMGLPYKFDYDKTYEFTSEVDKIKQIKSQWQEWCKNQNIFLKME